MEICKIWCMASAKSGAYPFVKFSAWKFVKSGAWHLQNLVHRICKTNAVGAENQRFSSIQCIKPKKNNHTYTKNKTLFQEKARCEG